MGWKECGQEWKYPSPTLPPSSLSLPLPPSLLLSPPSSLPTCEVQFNPFISRFAREKLRNKDATNKSSLKSFWNTLEGRVFQAIVSL